MFYCYRQNKLDDKFIVNDKVTVTVIIEADNEQDADSRAQSLGITFDSVVEEEAITARWDPAAGYSPKRNPDTFVRGSKHYDEKDVNVGEAFCYLYDTEGNQHRFVRAS